MGMVDNQTLADRHEVSRVGRSSGWHAGQVLSDTKDATWGCGRDRPGTRCYCAAIEIQVESKMPSFAGTDMEGDSSSDGEGREETTAGAAAEKRQASSAQLSRTSATSSSRSRQRPFPLPGHEPAHPRANTTCRSPQGHCKLTSRSLPAPKLPENISTKQHQRPSNP